MKYYHEPLYFVSQIYAPDQFDRVLYVFGCKKNECSQHNDSYLLSNGLMNCSWVCIRQQKETITEEKPEEAPLESIPAFSFSTMNMNAFSFPTEAKTESKPAESNDVDDILSLLNDLNQNQKEKKPKSNKKSNKKKNVKPSEPLTTDAPMFPAYHIDFFEEKEEEESHSKPLPSANIEISKEVTDEKYDDDSKSKLIIKFYSRLNRHPKQVIRYAYDGLPLLPCQPPTKIQPPRCKCGGQRVFECQILSSVISLFHIDDEDFDMNAQTSNPLDLLKSKYMDFSSLLLYCRELWCRLQTRLRSLIAVALA